jgi:hypothetical protein
MVLCCASPTCGTQAAAILKAEVYGIPRPDWASDVGAVSAAAGKVVVPEFKPKQGVKIETDPKVGGAVSVCVWGGVLGCDGVGAQVRSVAPV